MEHIAKKGRAGFYEGWIAEDIVTFLHSKGGLHTLKDFEEAKGEFITPIQNNL